MQMHATVVAGSTWRGVPPFFTDACSSGGLEPPCWPSPGGEKNRGFPLSYLAKSAMSCRPCGVQAPETPPGGAGAEVLHRGNAILLLMQSEG
jgi:hypothetical protein